MKNLIILLMLFLLTTANAQVAIEKETFRSEGSILEFNDSAESNGVSKGIILPVLQETYNIKQGALWLDATNKKVMYQSIQDKIALTDASTKDFSTQKSMNETQEGGVIISDGSVSTNDAAILKLDSNKMALLLPHVGDVTKDISNPEPGTIAYDVKSKSLAIFNGDNWYFWN